MKKALIFWGGWNGHLPEAIASRFKTELQTQGIHADLSPSLDCLDDADSLSQYAVIIPNWTMGTLAPTQSKNLQSAIRAGVGLAGIHGGMGDAFRGSTAYEWMVGGHFVGHPYVGDYTVRIINGQHPVTTGLPSEFPYESEQYYLLTDPANNILVNTVYRHEGHEYVMPVAWTKQWGEGRVFYSSLGHAPEEFDLFPSALTLAIRGILWAAKVL